MSGEHGRRCAPGGTATDEIEQPGVKGNLPDLVAALGLPQLGGFDRVQRHRRTLVRRHRELLAPIDDVACAPPELDEDSADHLMVVSLPAHASPAPVLEAMAKAGIGTSVHRRPVHHIAARRGRFEVGTPLSLRDQLAPWALNLPLQHGLDSGDVERVVGALAHALRRAGIGVVRHERDVR
jgi:dTDP-4-amino-4,6-dideoxygalactose transaminase